MIFTHIVSPSVIMVGESFISTNGLAAMTAYSAGVGRRTKDRMPGRVKHSMRFPSQLISAVKRRFSNHSLIVIRECSWILVATVEINAKVGVVASLPGITDGHPR